VSQPAAAGADTAGEVEPTGHFRIYLGAAPGVGKTYAMLSEGQRRRGRGADVVAGFVETYGRPLTQDLLNGFEIIPREAVDYRGARLEEMDLDAVLRRQPEVALVDELAHTTSAGRMSWTSSARASTSSPRSTSSTWKASPMRSSR
jgi:K+-sensing histidine kinase KdpD